jgi:hypothetical protein
MMMAALLGAVAFGTWAYSPGVARADYEFPCWDACDIEDWFIVLGTTYTTISTIYFIAADIIYGIDGEWLPPDRAGVQLGAGALPNFIMGPYWIARIRGGFGIGYGVVLLVSGTWFLTHAILSFILYERKTSP